MVKTRRELIGTVAGVVGTGALAGCLGDGTGNTGNGPGGPTAQSTFFVFGDIASRVAGDTASAELLVPVGQHGHGWEPGPRVREEIRGADLLFHGMEGFQPWVDDIVDDLDADGADVSAVDVSAGLDLLEGGGHDEHEEENHDEHEKENHDHGPVDPHFWMDPVRVKAAVGNVRQGLVDVDSDNAGTYAENAESYRDRLDDLDERIESIVADGSKDVVLVAGHDAFQYLGDRYGVETHSLTNVSPDDRPTAQDIEHAQEIIRTHDLAYICADPLESQQAADQLVAETDAESVLPLTSIPGLEDEWDQKEWGYVDVMGTVNLPTLERALEA